MRIKIDNISKEQAYQNTACMVLMKAIVDSKGMDINVRVGNSLNQGFFIYLGDTGTRVSSNDFGRIERRMLALIEADLPIETEMMTNAEAVKLWDAYDVPEKENLLSARDPEEMIAVSELDGYKNCFFGNVLPSTGYIELYELRRYRNGLLLRIPNMLCPDSIPAYRDDDKLYDAFAESKRVRKALGIDDLADLNEAIRSNQISEIIAKSEHMQDNEIKNLAESIVEGGRRIVLIAGPSSSGKTTFAKRLCAAIGEKGEEPIYMGTDDYFVERKDTPIKADGKPDYEGFACLDIELFNEQMKDLLDGKTIDAPEFDFLEGTKIFGKRSITAKPGQTIVIEGIHSLNDELTREIPKEWKYKIYISPLTRLGIDRHNRLSTTDSRMLRRMIRDNRSRGRDAIATISGWKDVREGENINIFPYSNSADYIFNSSLVYETSLMKTFAEPLLESVPEGTPEYVDAKRLLSLLKYFEKIEGAAVDAVPANSLLREFIG